MAPAKLEASLLHLELLKSIRNLSDGGITATAEWSTKLQAMRQEPIYQAYRHLLGIDQSLPSVNDDLTKLSTQSSVYIPQALHRTFNELSSDSSVSKNKRMSKCDLMHPTHASKRCLRFQLGWCSIHSLSWRLKAAKLGQLGSPTGYIRLFLASCWSCWFFSTQSFPSTFTISSSAWDFWAIGQMTQHCGSSTFMTKMVWFNGSTMLAFNICQLGWRLISKLSLAIYIIP